MNNKHTPTPWVYMSTKGIYLGCDENQKMAYAIESPSGNSWVLQLDREANAEFIVRAVNAHDELLRACNALVECQGEKAPTAFNMKFDSAVQKARDAIAKAEAKQ